jgi:hypothetical protein
VVHVAGRVPEGTDVSARENVQHTPEGLPGDAEHEVLGAHAGELAESFRRTLEVLEDLECANQVERAFLMRE